jgi:integrase
MKHQSTRPNTVTTYRFRAALLKPLFDTRLDRLTTRDIREWHSALAATGTVYSAAKALGILRSALALHSEDSGNSHMVAMPTNVTRRAERPTRKHLSVQQVRDIIRCGDVYVAFPFLSGTRISEQLGLCWDAVDFAAGTIRICRTQDKLTGIIRQATKTDASNRVIPMSSALRDMLAEWEQTCPSSERMFPAEGGGVLLYSSYLRRYWKPTLERLGLPYVPVHSARASFISMLQANGVPVAVAARLAGHSNPAVTLSHYTHSLSDGTEAMSSLDAALR